MAETTVTKRISGLMGNQIFQAVALVLVLVLVIGGWMLYKRIKARRSGKMTGVETNNAINQIASNKNELAKKYGLTVDRIDELVNIANKLAFELDTHKDDKTWGWVGWGKNVIGNSQGEIKTLLRSLRNEFEYMVVGDFYNKVFRRPYDTMKESPTMSCDIAKRIGLSDMAGIQAYQLWAAYIKRTTGKDNSLKACLQ